MASLKRDTRNKILGGVCSGLARFLGWDTAMIRLLFVVAVVFFGTGGLAYLILWVVMPSDS